MSHQGTARFQMPVESESMFNSANEAVAETYQHTKEFISNNPANAMLYAFGLGMGVGVGLALVLSGKPEPQYIDPSLRDKITNLINDHMPNWFRS